jgi:hypothetical protein
VGESGKEVVKVRCGVDLTRRIKSSKSASYVKSKGEKLQEVRTDFVSLPVPMLRLDALKYALAATDFQAPEDQALIQDAIDNRAPKEPKTTKVKKEKTVSVRASKKNAPSLDALKSRARKKVTTADVLNAVTNSVNTQPAE